MKPLVFSSVVFGIFFALCGCTAWAPAALKPGRAAAVLGGPGQPAAASVETPENPGTPTTQSVERTTTRRYVPPAQLMAAAPISPTASPTATPPAPLLLEETTHEKAVATVGAAQADTSRETSAKLASFRPVQFAGVGFLLFAAALFHPVLRAAVGGGKSVQMALAVGGVVLIFAPAILVGRETVVLVLVCVGLGAWWLNSRASYHEARADAAKPAA